MEIAPLGELASKERLREFNPHRHFVALLPSGEESFFSI
jgi:hypothetical protein